jgi:hypothetical protein
MGRKQFETVVAQASREKLVQYGRDVTTSLNASTGEEILLYSSPGTIAELVGIRYYADKPVGAASGSHAWQLSYKTGISNNIDLLYITEVFSAAVQFNNNFAINGTGSPTDLASQGQIVEGLKFDSVTPLRIFYNNLSNVATGTARRFIYATYIEREVRA